MIYLIDASAWVEYIIGSKKATRLSLLLEDNSNKFITIECSLAEIRGYALKNNMDFNKIYQGIKMNTVIFPVLRPQWIDAAKIRHDIRKIKPKFGLIDAILVAKQRELKCKIISGDYDFKNLKDVVYIGD